MKEPLASRVRPSMLDEYVGQNALVGKNGAVRKAIEKGTLMSFILWGPPGTGKTTLARIYAKALDAEWHELSAVNAGREDIRNVLQAARSVGGFGRPTILFLDEIHRFNKAQQDFLLPHVESGLITLVGATTENPSFEVIPALLSRMNVFVLTSLSEKDLETILVRSAKISSIKLTKSGKERIIVFANGDARRALGILESVSEHVGTDISITRTTVDKFIEHTPLRFDKGGEEHYNLISAYIKSMRASDPHASLYYLARMLESGEDPKFIARRMVIFASEDIGNALPTALVVANEVFRAVETIGMPEAGINLSHGTIYLATAPKDKSAYYALQEAINDVKKHGNLPIPQVLLNAPTKMMKNMGYGKGYDPYKPMNRMPEKLKGRKYF